MSNPSAEAFTERLTRHDIEYRGAPQPDGSYFLSIELAGKDGKLYNIVMVFSANGTEVGLRIFRLGHVPAERRRPMLRELNKLNGDYTWLRFYLDNDDDVAAALDGIISPRTAANVCWELVVRAFSVLDAVHGRIDAVLA